MIQTIRNHLYISTAVSLAALITAGAMMSKKYSTLARAEVIEEQYVPQTDDTKPPHYLLHLKVLDEKDKGDIYTMQVVENQGPLAVLDTLVGAGTELYFPIRKEETVLKEPTLLYPVGHFGQVHSDEIRVLHPWESSPNIRKIFESELKNRRDRERRQADREAGIYFQGRMLY